MLQRIRGIAAVRSRTAFIARGGVGPALRLGLRNSTGYRQMSGSSSVLAWSSALEEFALFRTLSSEQRLKALNAMVRQDLVRGQMLVAQGGPSDSLFLVLHGALAVRKTGYLEPIAELRAGELVG